MKDFLTRHASSKPVSFHMPGHKGGRFYKRFGYDEFLNNFIDWDITEIEGADNLFEAMGIIHSLQKRYAEIYGVKASKLLINGTSGGLIASILACLSSKGKIIMARNCHKSVFNAARLANAEVAYVHPEKLERGDGLGLVGGVSAPEVAKCIAKNPDASVVVITSPNYYGICSDIEAIAEVVHEAGMTLIVDQAHGAHLKFFVEEDFEMPLPAEMQGADIVLCSTHKTLASMTQTAVLNLCSERIPEIDLENTLQMIQSSSPSYVLMASLDINCEILERHGKKLIKEWAENLKWFYKSAKDIPGLRVMDVPALDKTKININFGIAGKEINDYLVSKGVFPELYTGNMVMLMSGIGNERADYEKLLSALREFGEENCHSPERQNPLHLEKIRKSKEEAPKKRMSSHLEDLGREGKPGKEMLTHALAFSETKGYNVEGVELRSRDITDDDFFVNSNCEDASGKAKDDLKKESQNEYRSVELPDIRASKWYTRNESIGKICAGAVVPYPSGIPLICPGEIITARAISCLDDMINKGQKIIGMDKEKRIRVIEK